MPGPDPDTIFIEAHEGGGYSVSFLRYLWTGAAGNRANRAKAILGRLSRRDWLCRTCGDDLPEWRRADALYCSEGCRKKAARQRRKARLRTLK